MPLPLRLAIVGTVDVDNRNYAGKSLPRTRDMTSRSRRWTKVICPSTETRFCSESVRPEQDDCSRVQASNLHQLLCHPFSRNVPEWIARSDLGRNGAFARWFCATATVCFQLVPSDRHIKVEEAQFLFPRQTPRTSQSYIVDHIEDRHVTPKEH